MAQAVSRRTLNAEARIQLASSCEICVDKVALVQVCLRALRSAFLHQCSTFISSTRCSYQKGKWRRSLGNFPKEILFWKSWERIFFFFTLSLGILRLYRVTRSRLTHFKWSQIIYGNREKQAKPSINTSKYAIYYP